MRQKNADKKSLVNKKSEKFFLEEGCMTSYNSSVVSQEDVNEGRINVHFLKWTGLSLKEKAVEEEKREAFYDLMAILVQKYGYKVVKK